ncbi:hypothetical protein ALC53_12555 [Atta colombica]|uniref:Uncharacterized protein n=1 Tax=Atta colombica TaxID=520822 RepID=A0A195AYH9_9HYME|nr:hypothetical protein ALC53_12555 [Atta colombica]
MHESLSSYGVSKNTVCRCGSRARGSNCNKVTSRLLNMQTLLARSRVWEEDA